MNVFYDDRSRRPTGQCSERSPRRLLPLSQCRNAYRDELARMMSVGRSSAIFAITRSRHSSHSEYRRPSISSTTVYAMDGHPDSVSEIRRHPF